MSWLSERDLMRCIKLNADDATLRAFQGIYSMDKLPNAVKQYPCLIIINTQSHNLPGEHWIAAFIGKNRQGEIFDSLALSPANSLIRWMNTYARTYRRNHLQYQHPLSSRCGAYVLYYVLKRLQNPKCVINKFTPSLYENEQRVLDFYRLLRKNK